MRKVAIIVICISLLAVGCAPSGGVEQTIRTKNNKEIPVRLLSVRSDALIVDILSPHSEEDSSHETNIARFGFDTIDVFEHWTVSPSRTFALASLSGAVVGSVIASKIRPYGWDGLYDGVAGAIIGFFVGSAVTGILAATGNHSYDPHDPDHLEKIMQLAVYKNGEPDELKKIK